MSINEIEKDDTSLDTDKDDGTVDSNIKNENAEITREEKAEYYKKEFWSWIRSLASSFFVVYLINTFIIQIVVVNGTSMQPTLTDGDKLIVQKINKNFDYGDVVVIENEYHKNLIKRVIAVAGDTIKIDFDTGDVFVNGMLLNEQYIRGRTTSSYGFSGETTVPEGYVFVMGDNRNASNDSRNPEIGFIDVNNIFGVTSLRIYPFDAFGTL